MKAIVLINTMVEAIPLLKILAKMTPSQYDDRLVELAERLKDNDDLIAELASWIALIPGFEAKALPDGLRDLSSTCIDLREAYRAEHGKDA
jgi:hypothetical protein